MKYLVIFLTPNGLRFRRVDFGENGAINLTLDTPFIVVGLVDVTISSVSGFYVTDSPEIGTASSEKVTDYQHFYTSLWQTTGSAGSMQFLLNYPPCIQDFIPAFVDVCLTR